MIQREKDLNTFVRKLKTASNSTDKEDQQIRLEFTNAKLEILSHYERLESHDIQRIGWLTFYT